MPNTGEIGRKNAANNAPQTAKAANLKIKYMLNQRKQLTDFLYDQHHHDNQSRQCCHHRLFLSSGTNEQLIEHSDQNAHCGDLENQIYFHTHGLNQDQHQQDSCRHAAGAVHVSFAFHLSRRDVQLLGQARFGIGNAVELRLYIIFSDKFR